MGRTVSFDSSGEPKTVFTSETLSLSSSTISIVSDISRAKNAVQQPQSYPIWSMFAGCCTLVKKRPGHGAWLCSLPGVSDRLLAALWLNMVIEERWRY